MKMKKMKIKYLLETEDLNRLILKHDEKYQKKLEDENIQFTNDVVNLNKIQKRLREPRINEIKNLYLDFSSVTENLKKMILKFSLNPTVDFDSNSLVIEFQNIISELNQKFTNLNKLILESDFESFAGSSKLGNIRTTRFGEMKSEYISKDFYHNKTGFKNKIKTIINILDNIQLSNDVDSAFDQFIKNLQTGFVPLLEEIMIFFKKWFSIEGRINDNKLYENIGTKDKSHQEKIEHHINSLSASINQFNKNISRGLNQDPRTILNIIIKNLKDLIESAANSKKLVQYKSTIVLSILMIKSFLRKSIKQDLIQNLTRANSDKTILPAIQDILDYLLTMQIDKNVEQKNKK